MLHAINSHVLTGTNPCINNAIHMLLIHGFAVLRISIPGPWQNLMSSAVTCTVANVISWRQNEIIICPESCIFKTFADNIPFRAILGTEKKDFSKHFLHSFEWKNVLMQLYRSNMIFWHINICWDISGSIETLTFQAWVYNPSIGAQQMLMHRKSCLIPIIKPRGSWVRP